MTATFANRLLIDWGIVFLILVGIGLLSFTSFSEISLNGVKQSDDTEIVAQRHPYELAAYLWFGVILLLLWLPGCVALITNPSVNFLLVFCLGSLFFGAPAITFLLSSLPWRLHLFLHQGIYAYRFGFPPLCGLMLTGPLSEVACIYVNDSQPTSRGKPRHYFVLMELSRSTSEFPRFLRWNRPKGPITVYVSRWKQPEQAEQQAAALRAALYAARQAASKPDAQVWPPPPQLQREGEEV